MRPRLLAYFFNQAISNIRANRLIHIVGISTMVISILIFGTFLFLFININNWIMGWGGTLTMSVYLEDKIGTEDLKNIENFIRSIPELETQRYLSKQEALEELRKALGNQSGLLSGLTKNPLPASFELTLKSSNEASQRIHKIKQELETIKGVSEVQYSQAWMERFKGVLNLVKILGFVIGGLLGVGVLFIVTNTIKLTIYSRKDEIEIFKLVGATDWFIKAPFLIEGMIQGCVSGLIALGILFIGYLFFSAKKAFFLGFALLELKFIPVEYALSLLVLSVLLGFLGSFIAIGRFFEI